tara:strand:+ start:2986 stop:3762 length:777 start_codon:yes stop_codon:yes gene_type:complete
MERKRRVLFIDSADLEEIEKALDVGFQGITTNPSLVAQTPSGDKEKPLMERYVEHMRKIAELGERYPLRHGGLPSLSVEVFSLEPDEMVEQARHLRKEISYRNLAIKIPISFDGKNYLDVVKRVSKQIGLDVNCTCCATASQLEMAAQAEARFVSFFYRRTIDHYNKKIADPEGGGGEYALRQLSLTRQYIDNNPFLNCEIILGSIRKPDDIVKGWEYGADIVTAGLKVLPGLVDHPGTDDWVKKFDEDLKEWAKGER